MNKQQIDEIREQAAAFTQPDIGDMVILDLLAHIEELEAENARLRDCLGAANRRYEWMAARYNTFRALSGIEVIKDGDSQ